jgi:hypothetical protein
LARTPLPRKKTLFEQAVVFRQAKHLVVLMKHLCHGSIIVKLKITTTLPVLVGRDWSLPRHFAEEKVALTRKLDSQDFTLVREEREGRSSGF